MKKTFIQIALASALTAGSVSSAMANSWAYKSAPEKKDAFVVQADHVALGCGKMKNTAPLVFIFIKPETKPEPTAKSTEPDSIPVMIGHEFKQLTYLVNGDRQIVVAESDEIKSIVSVGYLTYSINGDGLFETIKLPPANDDLKKFMGNCFGEVQ